MCMVNIQMMTLVWVINDIRDENTIVIDNGNFF